MRQTRIPASVQAYQHYQQYCQSINCTTPASQEHYERVIGSVSGATNYMPSRRGSVGARGAE